MRNLLRAFRERHNTDLRELGAEAVEIVAGIALSLTLCAALISQQGVIESSIGNTGSTIANLLGASSTSGDDADDDFWNSGGTGGGGENTGGGGENTGGGGGTGGGDISDPDEMGNYTLTYNTLTSTSISPKSVKAGTKVTLADAPDYGTSHTFVGWKCSYDSTVYGAMAVITMPASNVTMTAQVKPVTHTVTMYNNGEVYRSLTVNDGEIISLPILSDENGTEDGMVFGGWMTGTTAYKGGYNMAVYSDLLLTAYWTTDGSLAEGYARVTFDSQGGADIIAQEVEKNTYITLPSTTKSGFIFRGWIIEGELYKPGASYLVKKSVTATAKWITEEDLMKSANELTDYSWDDLKLVSSGIAGAGTGSLFYGKMCEYVGQTKEMDYDGNTIYARLVSVNQQKNASGRNGLTWMIDASKSADAIQPVVEKEMNSADTLEGGYSASTLNAWLNSDASGSFKSKLSCVDYDENGKNRTLTPLNQIVATTNISCTDVDNYTNVTFPSFTYGTLANAGTTTIGGENASLANVYVANASMTGSTLSDSNINDTSLTGVQLSSTSLSGTSASGATLTNTKFTGGTVSNGSLSAASVSGGTSASTSSVNISTSDLSSNLVVRPLQSKSWRWSNYSYNNVCSFYVPQTFTVSNAASGTSLASGSVSGTFGASGTLTNASVSSSKIASGATLSGGTLSNGTVTGTLGNSISGTVNGGAWTGDVTGVVNGTVQDCTLTYTATALSSSTDGHYLFKTNYLNDSETQAKLWVPSETEVFGSESGVADTSLAKAADKNSDDNISRGVSAEGDQFMYFANGNATKTYQSGKTYWLRSNGVYSSSVNDVNGYEADAKSGGYLSYTTTANIDSPDYKMGDIGSEFTVNGGKLSGSTTSSLAANSISGKVSAAMTSGTLTSGNTATSGKTLTGTLTSGSLNSGTLNSGSITSGTCGTAYSSNVIQPGSISNQIQWYGFWNYNQNSDWLASSTYCPIAPYSSSTSYYATWSGNINNLSNLSLDNNSSNPFYSWYYWSGNYFYYTFTLFPYSGTASAKLTNISTSNNTISSANVSSAASSAGNVKLTGASISNSTITSPDIKNATGNITATLSGTMSNGTLNNINYNNSNLNLSAATMNGVSGLLGTAVVKAEQTNGGLTTAAWDCPKLWNDLFNSDSGFLQDTRTAAQKISHTYGGGYRFVASDGSSDVKVKTQTVTANNDVHGNADANSTNKTMTTSGTITLGFTGAAADVRGVVPCFCL